MSKKVVCISIDRCHMCSRTGDTFLASLRRGRAYTVLAEKSLGNLHGYKLAEAPLPERLWHALRISPRLNPRPKISSG